VPTKDDKGTALVALLREVQPRERGLSCAVLTRKNDEAQRIASLLRRELRCDVVCESEEAVATDNAVTLVLLSVIQLGAHPQDGMAWHHVRMTPLRRWVEQHRFNAARTGEEVRRDLLLGGFLSVAEKWSGRLREVFPELDAFGEWRLRQFLEMCARFDESGSRDVDAFQSYAREHRVAVAGATQALQVMTIHKSKGLEFDLVILPNLQESILDDTSDLRLLTERDENGATQWVLDRPSAILLEWDGALVPNVDKHRSRSAFEGLCLLYVAMTRAKQGLYLITNDEPKPKARSEAKLVRSLLNPHGESVPYDLPDAPFVKALYESGTRDWFAQYPLKAVEEASAGPVTAPEQDLGALLRAVNQPVQRRTPSEEENFHLLGRDFLTPQREVSRRMGTLVHELFEAVTWLDAGGVKALMKQWQSRGLDQRVRFDEAAERVTKALKNEAARKFFENSGGQSEVWTERRFDLLLEGEWISGTLDRVVLECDANGICTQATLVDFKTDHVTSVEEAGAKAVSYAPQLDLYKKAVQRLTGLSAERIKTALIFVAGPWLVEG
jgi:ATP-dependent exoDNAse (exonuclease V) beta subunit